MRAIRSGIVFLLAAGLVVGCGGPPVGEVSGTVTYDGKAIDQGAIEFHPVDGNGPSTGGSITAGKYAVSKVPVGQAKVRITAAKDSVKMKMYDDAKEYVQKSGGELLPPKYSDDKGTELRYDVTPGAQTKDFTLSK